MTKPVVPAPGALVALRRSTRRWIVELLDGPNMPHLGARDLRLFGAIDSIAALQDYVVAFGAALGVEVRPFASNFEGELLERVHASAATADGYLVDPGGLTTVSEAWRHALSEAHKPVVEVHFYNLIANGEHSVFASSAIGQSMGLREHSYVAGLLGLVLALDDETFLNPDAPDSPTVRRGGTPYSFRKG